MKSLKEDFPNTPLIALVQSEKYDRYFGAFANGAEAQAWFNEQPNNIAMQFIPLRSPHIFRKYSDFYDPARDYDEAEYNHQQPAPKEKPVMSEHKTASERTASFSGTTQELWKSNTFHLENTTPKLVKTLIHLDSEMTRSSSTAKVERMS